MSETPENEGVIVYTLEQVEVKAPPPEIEVSKRMLDILDMINDPNKPVAEINRVIAGEIAAATGDITTLSQASGYKLKFLTERVRSLRELSKTLSEVEVLSKKDILNFDGPKFQFVFQEIISCIRKAAKDTGFLDDQINALLRSFRDTIAQREPELRKQTEKVDSSFIQR